MPIKWSDVPASQPQIAHPHAAFAEAPDERSRMGRISGVLWIVAALVGAGAAFLPGAHGEGARRMAEAIGTAVGLRDSDSPGPV